jgi:50S ribosomal protein L16 3-hydroxylase
MQTFDINDFLQHYWQQKPVVLRGFFSQFNDPIDEHDLAGLAQEEDIDSRIISNNSGNWHVTQGPITNFEDACKGKWTLLVQGVDRYIQDVSSIITPFSFIPNWRLDDLMVSFANKGAGVGAHIDQYDVFLVQGKGKRRWRVGNPGNYNEVFPHPSLRQIEAFVPIIDEVLLPGDVLYIPPGWPHDGKALEDCMTYSVGFRAPEALQLAESLAMMLECSVKNTRFTDPKRPACETPVNITLNDIQALKKQLIHTIESQEFTQALMASISEQGIPEFPVEPPFSVEEIANEIAAGASTRPAPGIKPLLLMQSEESQVNALYVNGEQFLFNDEDKPSYIALGEGTLLNAVSLPDSPSFAFYETLTTLINNGYWEWVEE